MNIYKGDYIDNKDNKSYCVYSKCIRRVRTVIAIPVLVVFALLTTTRFDTTWGAVAGFILSGPVGAVAGAIVGYDFSRRADVNRFYYDKFFSTAYKQGYYEFWDDNLGSKTTITLIEPFVGKDSLPCARFTENFTILKNGKNSDVFVRDVEFRACISAEGYWSRYYTDDLSADVAVQPDCAANCMADPMQ